MLATDMRNLIFKTTHGSYLYGLAHNGSDRDEYKVYEGAGVDIETANAYARAYEGDELKEKLLG